MDANTRTKSNEYGYICLRPVPGIDEKAEERRRRPYTAKGRAGSQRGSSPSSMEDEPEWAQRWRIEKAQKRMRTKRATQK